VYKPRVTHEIVNALSSFSNSIQPTGVPSQTTNASLFYIGPKRLNNVKEFLETRKIEGVLSM
jgi:hypothetical protein